MHDDPAPSTTNGAPPRERPPHRRHGVPLAIGAGVAAILALGGSLFVRASASTSSVALASSPKGVTVVEARAATYRASRRYVASVEPWLHAHVGPQLVSAYVDTVLVRPGARVARGAVLATLDCKSQGALSRRLAMRARALEARETALAKEAARVGGLLDGGFVSTNEAEQKRAEADSMEAQLGAAKAELAGTALEVDDCVLRAPFDGEVDDRAVDPGAFVRPGQPVVSVVDRSTVRVAGDVPEGDVEVVRPGAVVSIRLSATGNDTVGPVARRSPGADAATRTVHFEVDLPNADRAIPVGTSADVRADVGEPVPATELPLTAAVVRGREATVFVVEGGVARKRKLAVRGELGGSLFVDPTLPPGAHVVTEGRSLLADGDRVAERVVPARPAPGAERAEKGREP